MKTVKIFVFAALFACGSKPAQPGNFADFIPEVGQMKSKICTKENNGSRYVLEGVFQLPESSTISDGRVDLDFYPKLNAEGEGEGRGIRVTVKTPGDINDIWSTAEGVKGKGFRTEEGTISEDALVIHTKNGDAKAGQPVKLTIEIETTTHFQTGEVTACTYKFSEAEKK